MHTISACTYVFGILATFLVLSSVSSDCVAQHKDQVISLAKESIVFIEAKRSRKDGANPTIQTSSGFLVSKQGFGVTVSHAVSAPGNGETVQYWARIGGRYATEVPLEVIKRDLELDIALFRVHTNERLNLGLFVDTSANIKVGQKLYTLGFSMGNKLSFSEGYIRNSSGKNWTTTIPLNRGDSGAPVFDENNNVVAIAFGGFPNLNNVTEIIPAYFLQNFLESIPGIISKNPPEAMTNRCVVTPYFSCTTPQIAPVGTYCWCYSLHGPVGGTAQ